VPKKIHEGVDAIINFDKDAAITIVTNAINVNNDYATGNSFIYVSTAELYERLLKKRQVDRKID
jgi:hypothetical protein